MKPTHAQLVNLLREIVWASPQVLPERLAQAREVLCLTEARQREVTAPSDGRCRRCGHYHLDGIACGFHQCACVGLPAPAPACWCGHPHEAHDQTPPFDCRLCREAAAAKHIVTAGEAPDAR